MSGDWTKDAIRLVNQGPGDWTAVRPEPGDPDQRIRLVPPPLPEPEPEPEPIVCRICLEVVTGWRWQPDPDPFICHWCMRGIAIPARARLRELGARYHGGGGPRRMSTELHCSICGLADMQNVDRAHAALFALEALCRNMTRRDPSRSSPSPMPSISRPSPAS